MTQVGNNPGSPQVTPFRQTTQTGLTSISPSPGGPTQGPVDQGLDARTAVSHRLQDNWKSVAQGDSYHMLFGNQGYVSDLNDENLRGILSELPDGVLPDLKQKAQNGTLKPADIKELQSFLAAHNLDCGPAGTDGKYGPDTHKALQRFLNGEGSESAQNNASTPRPVASNAGRTTGTNIPPPGLTSSMPMPLPILNSANSATRGPAALPQVNSTSPQSSGAGASPVTIGPGTKVLMIGDSHTVGSFGQDLDGQLRGTGAQVATYGSAGASASNYVNGTPTTLGYSEHHADGTVSTTPYGQSHPTPKLEDLIEKEHPNVLVINLGANFRGASKDGIEQQVASLGQIAKSHNIPIVWVGPPKTGQDSSDSSSIQKFDQNMGAAVAPYGSYVASSQFTPQYVGADPAGLHYTGTQGAQVSRQWASGVFQAITGQTAVG